ncbi:MAG: hypothetical protein NVSMB21_01890 [Vulcanimicrobiaceae bacterium]
MPYVHLRAATLLTIAVSLGACSSGTTTLSPQPPAAGVAASPASLPVPAAGSSQATLAIGTSASSQALPATAGIVATLGLPPADGSADLAVVVTTGSSVATRSSHALKVTTRQAALGLPQGPYLAAISVTPNRTITFAGNLTASYDIGGLLNPDQKTALAFLAALNPQPQLYIGVSDPAGNFTAAGPLGFAGTTVTAAVQGPVTIKAGETYVIGLHNGPLTSATAMPTTSPTTAPTTSPTMAPTTSPTMAPTTSPSNTAAQSIAAAGQGSSDPSALKIPFAAGYSGALGYPANDSNVVAATSTAYASAPPNAPTPANETVVFGMQTVFKAGPPANQTSLTFQTAATTIDGFIATPASASGTYSLYVYAPGVAGTSAVFQAHNLTATNGKISFASPFSSLSNFPVPLPLTLDVELAQP